MKTNENVASISTTIKLNIKFLGLTLSIIAPEKGACATPAKKCNIATNATVVAETFIFKSSVYIATLLNQAPKYAINCIRDNLRKIGSICISLRYSFINERLS